MWRPGNWSNSTSQDALRNYTPSPLGRRPTPQQQQQSQQRPQLPHRASTISLAPSSANASTTSLPAMVKHQQSVGYSKAVSMPPPADTADPLAVLSAILGVDVSPTSTSPSGTDGEPEWMPSVEDARAVDLAGLSVLEFAAKCKAEQEHAAPQDDYEREREKFQELHKSIAACDEVLSSVESYLSAFKEDLGAVSAEIENLQTRSTSLTTRLENRKAVEKMLAPVIDDVVVPPSDVRRLVEGDVNDAWVKALADTERRRHAVEAMDETKIRAVREVKPEFERLIHKAIERIRDFFVARIKALRSPAVNAQTVQQAGFLRYRELFQFLVQHHAILADEIAQAYTNTMRWYYLTHFQRYHKALEKVRIHTMDKTDVLGQDEHARKGGLLSLKSHSAAPAYDTFNLGHRITVLRNRTAPILAASTAEDDKTTRFLEYPFRHFNAALIENVSAEYTFLTDFFTHKDYSQISHLFTAIFEPTYQLGQAFTKSLTDNSFDCIGILMAVRLNQYAALEMQKRRIPTADAYLNATNMLLWPRFQIIMSNHSESLRKFAAKASASTAPHALTQRFASLLHALLSLSQEAGDDEPVGSSLLRLRQDYEGFLERMAAAMPDEIKRARWRENNVSLVGTIISVSPEPPPPPPPHLASVLTNHRIQTENWRRSKRRILRSC